MDRRMKVTKSRLEQKARKGERTVENLCGLQILLISNTKALGTEISTSQCRSHSIPAPDQEPGLGLYSFLDVWPLWSALSPWTWGQRRSSSKHLGRLLSRDVKSLWTLHQGPLRTHFGRNEKAESIASIMLSCCSLESSLQPDCEIRGLGIETKINPNTKQGFCYITSFHHCLPRAHGHHNRSLPGSLF